MQQDFAIDKNNRQQKTMFSEENYVLRGPTHQLVQEIECSKG